MKDLQPQVYALISVCDKTGIEELASELLKYGIKILSTGGTYKVLFESGIKVEEVSAYTGQSEIMAGRLKTLHPKIHGGILGRLNTDLKVMADSGIFPINFVIVNLYPFQETINNSEASLADAVENIDIGGPAMLRAAAKNFERVTAVCDPLDYPSIIKELKIKKEISNTTRLRLAAKTFSHTARYDAIIANYLFDGKKDADNDDIQTIGLSKRKLLRYGENPHQKAWLYDLKLNHEADGGLELLRGKELSFNNMVDADSAVDCVMSFDSPACCIVKHANPCGVAQATNLEDAYRLAFEADKTSAFGGVIAFNQTVTKKVIQKIVENQFVEIIIAPDFESDMFGIDNLSKGIRFLKHSRIKGTNSKRFEWKTVSSGLLIQEKDFAQISELNIVSNKQPTESQLKSLMFAWSVASYVKSNAIVLASGQQTIGIGAGQMSRIDSVNLATNKAKQANFELKNCCMASDGFFPFKDGVSEAARHGVGAIIQPGGSIRDQEVIKEANENNIAMVFTGIRHFRH